MLEYLLITKPSRVDIMVDDSILSTNQQKPNSVVAAKDRKASSNLCTRWRENFYAIYLMVLINKLTISQQSASIA